MHRMAEILRCTDQWGRTITLAQARWQGHILVNHPEMAGQEAIVQQTLTDPICVNHDKDFPDRENFYRPFVFRPPRTLAYMKVCVEFRNRAFGQGARGEVVTAYPTTSIKQGEARKWSQGNF